MPLNLEDKRAIVAQVSEVVQQSHSVIAAEYRGMTVAQMTELRVQAQEAGVYLRVIRNTLARRALANTPYQCLQEKLQGPIILAFSQQDPGAGARVLKDYSKKTQHLVVKGIALSGQLLEASALDKVAQLPTYEEAISQLMSVMQAPISQFLRTLTEPSAKLVRTFAALREQQESATNNT